MTNTADELAHPEARRLLAEASLLRLGYDGLDGTPRVIPIGFLWNAGRIVVCTATSSPKVRALARRPQVAATIDEGSTPTDAKALLIRGTAVLETVDGVPREYVDAARKVLEPAQMPDFEEAVTATYSQMVRISITPRWARFYDFGDGRLPGYLQRLVEQAG